MSTGYVTTISDDVSIQLEYTIGVLKIRIADKIRDSETVIAMSPVTATRLLRELREAVQDFNN